MSKFLEIRKVMEYYHSVAIKGIEGGDHFRLDRHQTREYFFIHKMWDEKLHKYINEELKNKEKLIHLDICGRTNARTMGFHKSYCFALKTSYFRKKMSEDNHYFFDGDLFNPNDFNEFIELIKTQKAYPTLITFEPVAGLQDYGPEIKIDGVSNYREIVFAYLVKRLYQIVEILKPGGFLYMERPFQFDSDNAVDFFCRVPQNKFKISNSLKKVARKLKCKIEIGKEIGGPYFLLRKNII